MGDEAWEKCFSLMPLAPSLMPYFTSPNQTTSSGTATTAASVRQQS